MTDPGSDWLDDPAVQWRWRVMAGYEGPFERVMNWLWCLDPVTNEIIQEVPEGSPRNWLACRAEGLDRAWREHYVHRRRKPPDRWRRKVPALDDEDGWLSSHGMDEG